jgi:hypothetical protein
MIFSGKKVKRWIDPLTARKASINRETQSVEQLTSERSERLTIKKNDCRTIHKNTN